MSMCKYTHCVVTLSWSKHSSSDLTWIHTHTNKTHRPAICAMHALHTYSDVQYEHTTQLHNKISVYRVSLKGHSCLMCSHNAARTLPFLPINTAVKRAESFHEWKVKLIEHATWPDQHTLWILITELACTLMWSFQEKHTNRKKIIFKIFFLNLSYKNNCVYWRFFNYRQMNALKVDLIVYLLHFLYLDLYLFFLLVIWRSY